MREIFFNGPMMKKKTLFVVKNSLPYPHNPCSITMTKTEQKEAFRQHYDEFRKKFSPTGVYWLEPT